MLLNSVTKIFFAIVVARENIKVGQANMKKEAPKKRPMKRGRK